MSYKWYFHVSARVSRYFQNSDGSGNTVAVRRQGADTSRVPLRRIACIRRVMSARLLVGMLELFAVEVPSPCRLCG